MKEQWLVWANEIQAIAQNGLLFGKDKFDIERYQALRKISADILAHHSSENSNTLLQQLELEIGYATPKIDVRGVVFHRDEILLVKEIADGLWTLPGGWADVNESASEAVVREVYEESGYVTSAIKLLALFDKHKHDHPPQFPHAYKCFFLCKIISKREYESLETSEAAFFAIDHLPELSIHRVTKQQLIRLFQHLKNPELATDFD